MKQNWKTTTAGIASIVVAVGTAAQHLVATPPTPVDWGAVIAAIMAGIGLIVAADNKRQ